MHDGSDWPPVKRLHGPVHHLCASKDKHGHPENSPTTVSVWILNDRGSSTDLLGIPTGALWLHCTAACPEAMLRFAHLQGSTFPWVAFGADEADGEIAS